MIIDAHVHLVPGRFSAGDLVGWMDRDGIDRAVLLPEISRGLPPSGEGRLGLARWVFQRGPACLGRIGYRRVVRGDTIRWGGETREVIVPPDNTAAASAVLAFPDRLLYFPAVRSGAELAQAAGLAPVAGVKVHAWWHRVRLAELGEVYETAAERGWPVLIHLGGDGPTGRDVFGLVRRFARTTFILAHAGLPWFSRAARAAATHGNVYLDTSGPMVDDRLLARLAVRPGHGKLVFGTDAPAGMWAPDAGISWSATVARYRRLFASEGARQQVLGGNLVSVLPKAHK